MAAAIQHTRQQALPCFSRHESQAPAIRTYLFFRPATRSLPKANRFRHGSSTPTPSASFVSLKNSCRDNVFWPLKRYFILWREQKTFKQGRTLIINFIVLGTIYGNSYYILWDKYLDYVRRHIFLSVLDLTLLFYFQSTFCAYIFKNLINFKVVFTLWTWISERPLIRSYYSLMAAVISLSLRISEIDWTHLLNQWNLQVGIIKAAIYFNDWWTRLF